MQFRKSSLGFDRLSILALKIYHMNEEANRAEASEHRDKCQEKIKYFIGTKNRFIYAIDDLLLN
jgi:hypothetical protein